MEKEIRKKIGVFSASSPTGFDYKNRTNRAINFLESKDFYIKSGDLLFSKDFYRTGSIKQRVDEINSLVSEDIDILMSSIGGSNTNSIIEYIDYKKIDDKKLVVCGFSDTTALLLAVIKKCPNARVMYGPALIPSFGDYDLNNNFANITYEYFFKNLSEEKITYNMPTHWTDDDVNWKSFERAKKIYKNSWKFINSDSIIKGRIIGGNLNTILGTWGSEFGLEVENGDILLIEDSNKTAEIVEKNFSFLKINKVFDKCGAIILGKHEKFDSQNSFKKPIDILKEVIGEKIIPIVYDVDFCHTKPMLVVELNKLMTIDFKNKTLKNF